MPQAYRVGLIGAGRYTRQVILPSFMQAPDFELVTVCNRREDNAARVATEFAIPAYTKRWQEVVDDQSLDAVIVATPPRAHAEIVVAALEAGKHVLCQTRMAATLDEARLMARTARKSTAKAMLVPPDCYVRGRRFVAHLLAEGALGQVRLVQCSRCRPSLLDSTAALNPRQDPQIYGAANPLHLGLCWDVLEPWLGPAERVLAYEKTFTSRRLDPSTGQMTDVGLPDAVIAIAEMESGASVVNMHSGVALAGDDKIVIHGEAGTLIYEAASERIFHATPGGSKPDPLDIPPEFDQHGDVAADFAYLLKGGPPLPGSTFDDGLGNIEYLTACHVSATEGRWVDLAEMREP